MKAEDPYIVCLHLDSLSSARLTAWRQRYFPPERNFLTAHMTLYHRLPSPALQLTRTALTKVASQQPAFDLLFAELSQNGAFLGIKVPTVEVIALKRQLDHELTLWLAPQDRQKLSPHVTVMNNAPPEAVEAAAVSLHLEFAPWIGKALGFQLFRYRRGPWEWLEDFPFAEA